MLDITLLSASLCQANLGSFTHSTSYRSARLPTESPYIKVPCGTLCGVFFEKSRFGSIFAPISTLLKIKELENGLNFFQKKRNFFWRNICRFQKSRYLCIRN